MNVDHPLKLIDDVFTMIIGQAIITESTINDVISSFRNRDVKAHQLINQTVFSQRNNLVALIAAVSFLSENPDSDNIDINFVENCLEFGKRLYSLYTSTRMYNFDEIAKMLLSNRFNYFIEGLIERLYITREKILSFSINVNPLIEGIDNIIGTII